MFMAELSPGRARVLAGVRGRGIEIGALSRPLPVGPHAHVEYVDLYTSEEAALVYPEAVELGPIQRPDLVAAADDLSALPTGSQDFVLSSHLLEHLADPIAALAEWRRVLRPKGLLVLMLPDKRYTFDRERPRTRFGHLWEDHLARKADDVLAPARRNRAHYLEWAVAVNGLLDPKQAEYLADLLAEAGYPIHFHCWIADDVAELFERLRATTEIRFDVVERFEDRERAEFGFALEAS